MSSLNAFLIAGGVVGTGAAVLVRQLVPAAPKLSSTLRRLNPPRTAAGQDPAPADTPRRFAGQVAERIPGSVPRSDLDLLGQPVEQFLLNKLTLALLGLLAPVVVVGGWSLMGLGVPLFIPGAVGLLAALGLWFVPDLSVRAEAAKARVEGAHAAAAFLELVAMRMASNKAASQALWDASQVGRGWFFARVREVLLRARTEKTSPWLVLEQMGTHLKLPALRDIADIVQRAESEGASVYDTLRHHAASLRSELLTVEAANANENSEKMHAPGALLTVIVMALMAFPAALKMFAI
ncbi:hypothetical protein [Streptomyces sp. N35]|uniref:hypothetical protein n=1 Tax=Streptomyces sp. N35 TaxID=2795730 RepID=UPI0018F2F6AB|nr:hypothetical protein [Streptomyces sp. N35]